MNVTGIAARLIKNPVCYIVQVGSSLELYRPADELLPARRWGRRKKEKCVGESSWSNAKDDILECPFHLYFIQSETIPLWGHVIFPKRFSIFSYQTKEMAAICHLVLEHNQIVRFHFFFFFSNIGEDRKKKQKQKC